MGSYEKDFVRSFLGMHRQMERFLNDVFRSGHTSSFTEGLSWSPPVDIFETENCYMVKVELAGVDPSDIDIVLDDGQLTIEGVRRDRGTEAKISCHQMEIPYGHFKRTIFISRNIDEENSRADYVAGFLEICLARADRQRHKKVEIKVK